jgi:hypothetical protein
MGNFLVHAVFRVLAANRRLSSSLQVIGKRVAARPFEQRPQMCVATNAGGEAVAIGLPKCIDAGVASLLTDLPAAIAFAIIGAGAFILSTLALSGSFLWHGTLISNSSEPQPHSQLSALGSILDGGAGAFACQLRMWAVSSQPFSSPNPGAQARNRPLHFSISRSFADRVGIVTRAARVTEVDRASNSYGWTSRRIRMFPGLSTANAPGNSWPCS